MINYKCAACNARLETPDELGGESENCPACNHINQAPFTKEQERHWRQEQKRAIAAEHERQKRAERAESRQQVPAFMAKELFTRGNDDIAGKPDARRCQICGESVVDDIALSDGGMVHESCIQLLQSQIEEASIAIDRFQQAITKHQRELTRREGVGFKITSIFSKPTLDIADLNLEIEALTKDKVRLSNRVLAIESRLTSIYDYYLTYPPDWDKRKDEVIARDGELCSECSSRRHLHLHHITKLSNGGSNKISNLKLLCASCHSEQHGGKDFTNDYGKSESAFSKRVSSIRDAIQQSRRIEFDYKKPTDTSYMTRTVEPDELINVDHHRDSGSTLCVRGYCELRQEQRTFALKRMRGLKVL